MEVSWSTTAREQLAAIASARSQDSGDRIRAAILSRGEQLTRHPYSGRMIPEFQVEHLREVLEQGFRIFYEVFEDRIGVFGVVSGRMDVFGDD